MISVNVFITCADSLQYKDPVINSLQAADGFNNSSAQFFTHMYKHTNTNFAHQLSHQLKQTKQTDIAEFEPNVLNSVWLVVVGAQTVMWISAAMCWKSCVEIATVHTQTEIF